MTDQETAPFERPMGVVDIIKAYEQQATDHQQLMRSLRTGVIMSLVITTLFLAATLYWTR